MKPARVVFLESLQGVESLFTRGLRRGALGAGWHVEMVFLMDARGTLRPMETVQSELINLNPDLICFLMDAPLAWPELWQHPALIDRPKISLWFDDFYRSPRTLGHPQIWAHWQNECSVRVGIWDGYWRRQWEEMTGGEAFPIHLAADANQFAVLAESWKPEWADRATFIGTIPSLKSLEKTADVLPSVLKKLLMEVINGLEKSTWPLRPYETSHQCRQAQSEKKQLAFRSILSDPYTLSLWNFLLWRWGKRIARLRGLRAIAEVGPLAILSGHGTESYAGEEELKAFLPAPSNWVFADTRNIPATAWGQLFRTGKWQLQITDPQSIEGGLPFRVFESAACATPLLSDYRSELAELFPISTGLMLAHDPTGLQKAASQLFEANSAELIFRGALFQQRFMDGHTWDIRWRQMVENAFCLPSIL